MGYFTCCVLGPIEAKKCSEVTTRRSSTLPSVNSSVAPGGMLTLIPVLTSTNNNDERNVKCRVTKATLTSTESGGARPFGDISSLVEVMNQNTRAIL